MNETAGGSLKLFAIIETIGRIIGRFKIEPQQMKKAETEFFLRSARKEGKILNWGMTFDPLDRVFVLLGLGSDGGKITRASITVSYSHDKGWCRDFAISTDECSGEDKTAIHGITKRYPQNIEEKDAFDLIRDLAELFSS